MVNEWCRSTVSINQSIKYFMYVLQKSPSHCLAGPLFYCCVCRNWSVRMSSIRTSRTRPRRRTRTWISDSFGTRAFWSTESKTSGYETMTILLFRIRLLLRRLERGSEPMLTYHDSWHVIGLNRIWTCDHRLASPELYHCTTLDICTKCSTNVSSILAVFYELYGQRSNTNPNVRVHDISGGKLNPIILIYGYRG